MISRPASTTVPFAKRSGLQAFLLACFQKPYCETCTTEDHAKRLVCAWIFALQSTRNLTVKVLMNKLLLLQLLYLLAVPLKHFLLWPHCNCGLPHLFPTAVSRAYQWTSWSHVGVKKAALILIKNVVCFTVPSKLVQILHIFYVVFWNGETPQQGLRKVMVYGNKCIRGRTQIVLFMCFFLLDL